MAAAAAASAAALAAASTATCAIISRLVLLASDDVLGELWSLVCCCADCWGVGAMEAGGLDVESRSACVGPLMLFCADS